MASFAPMDQAVLWVDGWNRARDASDRAVHRAVGGHIDAEGLVEGRDTEGGSAHNRDYTEMC